MSSMSIVKKVTGNVDDICNKVIEVIKPAGFGILTRIDFDQKIKEKINEIMAKTVILGACNPKLAFEAYKQSTDVALLIPCNIVVRDIGGGVCSVEAMRPSKMLEFLENVKNSEMIMKAESDLERVILAL